MHWLGPQRVGAVTQPNWLLLVSVYSGWFSYGYEIVGKRAIGFVELGLEARDL